MTPIQHRLAQAATVLIGWPIIFCLMSLARGHGMHVTEFEDGGIIGAAIIRFYDAFLCLARK